jgi:2-methylisocitrate lyase-like PEP mutase family enzyme
MTNLDDRPTRLRALLDRKEIVQCAGAFDAMAALIIDRLGFEALYITGGGSAFAMHGLPDFELVTMTEMAGTIGVIARSVGIPVIGDADTGYGNPLNVRRTVGMFERAGVGGLHIEDQTSPKRCGQLEGKSLVTTDEMVQKIRAAVDARENPDTVIIARTDALLVEGTEPTLERCKAYVDAGADALYVEAPSSVAEVGRIAEVLADRTRLVYGQSASGRTPFMSTRDLEDLGFAAVLYPNFATLAAIKAIKEVLGVIRQTGSAESVRDRCVSLSEMHDLSGQPELERIAERYVAAGVS